MRAQLPADKLKTVWAQVQGQVGSFKGNEDAKLSEEQKYKIVDIMCHFERSDLKFRTAFNDAGKIAGLFFLPPE